MIRLQLLKAVSQILPFLLSIIGIIHTSLYFFFDIDIRMFSIIGGIGLIPLIYLWIASWCFRFCFHQKIFLYYLILINCINIIDEYYVLPIDTYNYYIIGYITFGCTIILYAILKYRENRNKTKKKLE